MAPSTCPSEGPAITAQSGPATSTRSTPPGAAFDLAPFVSELARDWSRDTPALTEQRLTGTLVFADISGFTRLTERLASRGRFGAEEMSDHLDLVLTELLEAAYGYGGWLVKWGGDALLLMYDRADHAEAACAASAAMQLRMRQVGVLDTSVGRVRLRMSVGVHTGRFDFRLVGIRHRELLITGDDATVTARLEATAEAGEILVSRATAERLPEVCRGAAKGDGILLARPPGARPGGAAVRGPDGDVSHLLPQLVLSHLTSGGGAGEHRPVTVAFLEFSGMARLRQQRGRPESDAAVRHLVAVAQEACHRNTVSFHETDISPDGGKIMLVAGAPRGVADPAEAMLCTLRQVFEDPGPLSVRAGVTTGRAFTGCIGPPRRRSYSVKGDVVNLAARIMGKTPAAAIWALPEVVDASRTRFEAVPVPPFAVKGKVAPVPAVSVGAPLARSDRTADLPLIGRAADIALLETSLDRARNGAGLQIELVGDAGMGKTRLLAELSRLAEDLTVLSAAAEPYHASSPYSLVRQLLQDSPALQGLDEAATAARLLEWCGHRAPELLPWLPLLGPPLGIRLEDTPQTSELAPEFRAERLRAVSLELLRVALPEPTLVMLDDMQFADDASAELLRYVCQHLAGRPWLVVLARRSAAGVDDADDGQRQRLVLGPLDPESALVLTCADTDDEPLPPHVTAAVVERGGGNPAFLRQLARAAAGMQDATQLPDSVETVVAARIDQLRPAAREVLRAAAVIGMSVDYHLLDRLLADGPAPPVAVLDELDEFLEPDGRELRFRQALIRDTAYEGLAFRRRAALHGRLAELLVEQHGAGAADVAAVLSLHHLHAGQHAQALATARAAAERAAAAYAHTEAASLYQRALTAAARMPQVDRSVRGELQERLGDVQVSLGLYDASDRSYTAACRLRHDDRLAIARIGLKRARSASQRGAYALTLDRLRRVTRTLEQVNAQEVADLRLEARMRAAFTQFRQGRLAAARTTCLEILATGDEQRQPEVIADALGLIDVAELSLGIGNDGERARHALRLHEQRAGLAGQARIHNQIGYRSYLDGHWDAAVAAYQSARDLYERLGDLPNAAVQDANIAEILLDQGRLPEAESALRQAIRIWRAAGADNDVAFGHALLGRTLARQGRYDDAGALLDQARARFAGQGAKAEVVDADAYRAECLMLRGHYRAALGLAERTLAAAGRLSEQPTQAPLLHRIIGGCQDALGDGGAADTSYERSLDLARRRGAYHDVAFTVAAMRNRRTGHRTLDPALLDELIPLQRKLGLSIDLETGASLSDSGAGPPRRSG